MGNHNPGQDAVIAEFYSNQVRKVQQARSVLGRPLTLTEKIFASHSFDLDTIVMDRGKTILKLDVDRVALQDATAQMTLLQFMQSGRIQVAKPTTVHCDHLITAQDGAKKDLLRAYDQNAEVYEFLRVACSKFGIGFWPAGAGIIHQVVLENHAFPGGLLIGTDSHTPNASGLSMLAIGVGGADAVEVMIGRHWEVLCPKIIGVRLTGVLKPWSTPKDIILHLCKVLTTAGGTNKVIEYFGPGVATISATGRATICNMGAELGATTSIFPFDKATEAYLRATGRKEIADDAGKYESDLRADPEILAEPAKYFDEIIEIKLDELEPQIAGPHRPDRGRAVSDLMQETRSDIDTRHWPQNVSACLIGSCTNSSLEDMHQVADVLRQAKDKGIRLKTPLLVSPGSERVRATLEEEGVMSLFEEMGCVIFSASCGPCIGQWNRVGVRGENVIVSSFNRNFPKRNDGNPETLSFVASPMTVTFTALSGKMGFNPEHESMIDLAGIAFQFSAPHTESLEMQRFANVPDAFLWPAKDPSSVNIFISPTSERLQVLERFESWEQCSYADMPILAKVKGQTTTDAISPAGKWLDYRGHLDKISNNMLLGAMNAFNGKIGSTQNPIVSSDSNTEEKPFAQIARILKAHGHQWVIVTDDNYGEGSSREHAAMSPRYLGCTVVIGRSFARIHETNLKKQGILPLVLVQSGDYEKFGQYDRVSIPDIRMIMPHTPVMVLITKPDGVSQTVVARHTMTEDQIGWLRAGSAINTWCPVT